MFTRILLSFFGFLAIGVLYASWTIDEKYAPILIPIGIIIAAIIVFTPQIDWWWSNRYPPKTDKRVIQFLETFYPYYNSLAEPLQKTFLIRAELIIKSMDWTPMGFEDIPADVQYVISTYAVRLSLNRQKFIFKYWEKVILYKHPFPSPQHPKQLHHSEIFYEDNVVLFDFPHLIKGFINPDNVFPIGLYEMARIYLHDFKVELGFNPHSFNEAVFSAISGKDFDWIRSSIGLDVLDGEAIAVVCYFLYLDKTMELMPDWFINCKKEFG
ncbi:MAG TPA: hypothetical protein VK590_10480 [Saprospiraceae bacterium]|nr:hypothetical protein [Saprospiraceae bacterium]